MLHMAAHTAAFGDTGAEGRYHSQTFAEAAQGLGLSVSSARIPGIGCIPEGLARSARARYAREIRAIDRAMNDWRTAVLRASPGARPWPRSPSSSPPPRRSASAGLTAGCTCRRITTASPGSGRPSGRSRSIPSSRSASWRCSSPSPTGGQRAPAPERGRSPWPAWPPRSRATSGTFTPSC
jgi:hypothetical protein